jgi:hypothetical protein
MINLRHKDLVRIKCDGPWKGKYGYIKEILKPKIVGDGYFQRQYSMFLIDLNNRGGAFTFGDDEIELVTKA